MKNPWEDLKTPTDDLSVLLIDDKNPLDFYWAKDHTNRYLMILDYPINEKNQKKRSIELVGIEAFFTRINSEKLRLILMLNDKNNWGLFYTLCMDLLSATYDINSNAAYSVIMTRLERWQDFLKKKKPGILTEEQIKGLIGELILIRDYLAKSQGITNSIRYWVGPEGSPQDFTVNDSAIEVKCQIGTSIPSVKISSEVQLYTQLTRLYLFVVTLGKTKNENLKAINLNLIVSEVRALLNQELSKSIQRFEDLLLDVGYMYNEKYDDYNYILSEAKLFEVKDEFPRVTPYDLKPGIDNLSYYVKLADCKPYQIDIKSWEL